MSCPICDNKETKSDMHSGPMGIEESHEVCEKCNLFYTSFEYGHSSTDIGIVTTYSSYNDPSENSNILSVLHGKIIRYYRQKLNKITYPIIINKRQGGTNG